MMVSPIAVIEIDASGIQLLPELIIAQRFEVAAKLGISRRTQAEIIEQGIYVQTSPPRHYRQLAAGLNRCHRPTSQALKIRHAKALGGVDYIEEMMPD